MNNELQYLIIKTTSARDSISSLEKMGYTYAEIANVFSELINEHIFEVNDDLDFELSEIGLSYFKTLEKEVLKEKGLYIKSMDSYRIEKLSKYDIFIE